MRFLAWVLLVSFPLLFPVRAGAETVLVQNFDLENDVVPVPCEVEKILADSLIQMGCDKLNDYSATVPPDIIVTGSLWAKDGNTYATILAADTVNSQIIVSSSIYLPVDEAACSQAVLKVSDEIGDPPFYARKQNFMDSATGMEFVYIPGGSFRMGYGEEGGTFTTVGSFFMARQEVTQRQWMKVMGSNPSFFTGDPDLPVENVSWYDAQEYIRLLNEKTGRHYRLPTEAEWEYAARTRGRAYRWAGTNIEGNVDHFAWYSENGSNRTHKVGTKRANGLGLYDMSGNVWEWCYDRYVEKASKSSMGELSDKRVIRGGSWMMDKAYAKTNARDSSSPESRYQDNGFRLLLDIATPKELAANSRAAGTLTAEVK